MVCGGGPSPLGVTPMILLVLCLHLPDSVSKCISRLEEPALEPLPAGMDPYMQPAGILQPQVHPQGQRVGNEPGVYGGTDSESYGGPGPGSYGIDGPGAYGGAWTGSYGGTGCASYEAARTGSYEQPGPGSYGINGPETYEGAKLAISVGGSPSQYGMPGAGYGVGSVRPPGHVRPVYKHPSIPFVPGLHDEARTEGHVWVNYRDLVSYGGNAQLGLGAGGFPRPQYKDPSIPYVPSLSELPNHARHRVLSMPRVSTDNGVGEGAGTGDVSMPGSSNPTLPNSP
ncbi:collagen alpha-2(I) chain-like [Dermochelys coriacea]|uniref:collagen alpha-2(I) chain-like n=1 Tax=Dermochelys coriacea TaxID=27794 RepID=UPI0018E7C289|nr:collagen alpha-2(I) chain-like [Dermochelys coriacea]